ncbi:Uncharacterised protein [Mycobacteroides abscessus subsp. abscessus]|nr:Uncharacterised protein [Mycobacteroides abscessus subsp. abscessus]
MALTHETQCVGAVEGLRARREIRTRHRFVDRFVEAHVDSAQGIRHQHEPEHADLGVAIDSDAGQPADGLDQRRTAGVHGLALGGL